MSKLRVWWCPQIPCTAFYVYIDSVEEGCKIMDVLAKYDMFQYENNIKPDYCNAGGIEVFEDDEWTDWYDDETGEDDPYEYLEANKEGTK